jgi:hypothetical protein
MNQGKAQVISALIGATAVLAYCGVLAYLLTRSRDDTRISRARQWMRYYRWKAWWDSLPTWKQEALIVRGGGPQ